MFVFVSTLSAQNSTSSTPSDVVVINGQRYVLVPERTFGKIEKLTAELPALRDENAALKAEKTNADQTIAKQTELISLNAQIVDAKDKTIVALEKQVAAEQGARVKVEQALDVSQKETARQEKRAGKWKKIAVASWIVTAAIKIFAL